MPRSITAGLYRGCTFSLFKETTTLFLGWVVTVLREGEGEGESNKMPFKNTCITPSNFSPGVLGLSALVQSLI